MDDSVTHVSEAQAASVASTVAPPARHPMFPLRWWMIVAVFVPSYLLRLVGFASVEGPVEDMYMHVENAFYYTRWGLLGPDNWWTHPAKHIGLRFAFWLFGNDIVGWRLPGIIMGSLSVVLLALIARRMFRSLFPALAATVLFALDPLSIAFSRTTFEDTIAVFLMLASILFWLRAIEHDLTVDWLLCGLTLGVATACRQYAAIPGVIMLLASWAMLRRAGKSALLRTALPVISVAVFSYFVWWLPWIVRGYSMLDWWHLQADALAVQGPRFKGVAESLLVMSDPRGWMIRWVGLVLRRPVGTGEAISMMANDPVVWVFFVPSCAYLAYRAWIRRRWEWAFVVMSFALLYAFFVFSSRPILVYSATVIVPFGCLALAYALSRIPLAKARWAFLGAAALWGLYLYPLAAGIATSAAPWAWLLERISVVGGGS